MKNFIIVTSLLVSVTAFSQKTAATKMASAKAAAVSSPAKPASSISFKGATGSSEFSATGRPAMTWRWSMVKTTP